MRLTVSRAGPLTTVQDRGRPGYAHLAVPRSGAADEPSFRLANRLVGILHGCLRRKTLYDEATAWPTTEQPATTAA